MTLTILVVGNSPGVRDTFPTLLRLEGFQATTAKDARSGIALALANPYDLILVDHHLPDTSGIDIASELTRLGSRAPIVVFTAFPNEDASPFEAHAAGAAKYVERPLWGDDICRIVREALSGSFSASPKSFPPATLEIPSGPQKSSIPHLVVDARLRHVVRTINADPRLSAEDLARRVGLSESRLRHMFAQELGVSLVRFVRSLRLDHGARLLCTTYDGISQIADRLGRSHGRKCRIVVARSAESPSRLRAHFRARGGLTVFEDGRNARNRRPPSGKCLEQGMVARPGARARHPLCDPVAVPCSLVYS